MSDMVRVKFLTSHGSHNAGEVAGFPPAIASKLCSGKRPIAVPASKASEQPVGLEAQIDALPVDVKEALAKRFMAEVESARKPLLDELAKVRAEFEPIREQFAETQALVEKLKARIVELEAAPVPPAPAGKPPKK